MTGLSDDAKRQLREILEQQGDLSTTLQRQFLLENAGLRWLEPQLDMNAKTRLFCFDLVSRCEQAGNHPALGESALALLLRHLRDEVVPGHNDKVALLTAMLAYTPPPTPVAAPPITRPSSAAATTTTNPLWQEFVQAEEDQDWDAAIIIGERLRQQGYKVRDVRPTLAYAYVMRGRAAHRQNEFEAAIHHFSRAIELTPQNAIPYNSRGYTYYIAASRTHPIGDFAKAIADQSRAIEISPQLAMYYRNRALSYAQAARLNHPVGDFAKAIADFSQAIILEPDKASHYQNRGLSYHHAAQRKHPAGDFAKAIADYNRAIALDPQDSVHYMKRGLCYQSAAVFEHPIGDFVKAIADFSHAIALKPETGAYYHYRAECYADMFNLVASYRDHQTAKKLGYKAE